MTDFATLRNIAMRIAPRWLKGPNASRVLYAPGLVNDAAAVLEGEGLRAGLPQIANDDALPFLGRDRVLTRGPSELAADYSTRLTSFRKAHRGRGGTYELLRQLRYWYSPYFRSITYVQNNSIWYQIDAGGTITKTDKSATPNWKWDARWGGVGAAANPVWWRFWIIVDGSPYFQWKWGDGHHYGDPDLVWGTTMPAWAVNGIRGIIKTWKCQDTFCDRVILTYDPTLFLPTNAPGPTMPGGNWDVASNRATAATYIQGVI